MPRGRSTARSPPGGRGCGVCSHVLGRLLVSRTGQWMPRAPAPYGVRRCNRRFGLGRHRAKAAMTRRTPKGRSACRAGAPRTVRPGPAGRWTRVARIRADGTNGRWGKVTTYLPFVLIPCASTGSRVGEPKGVATNAVATAPGSAALREPARPTVWGEVREAPGHARGYMKRGGRRPRGEGVPPPPGGPGPLERGAPPAAGGRRGGGEGGYQSNWTRMAKMSTLASSVAPSMQLWM